MIVNDEYIIERVEIEERELEQGSSGIHMRYNQTDPSIIRDGVDFIAVTEEGDEKYRVDFQGYASGRMYITEEGVQELGEKLTTDENKYLRGHSIRKPSMLTVHRGGFLSR